MPFTIEADSSPEALQAVSDGLTAYNEQHVGAPDNVQPLTLVVRDAAGTIIAGLVGQTFWAWLHVDMLWVHEAHRRQRWGSALLDAAEAEARARGCRQVFLDTMSFQALPFYLKRGYTVWGQLDDFPLGHARIYLKRTL